MECCFKNIVERHIETIRTKEAYIIIGLFLKNAHLLIAICVIIELRQWILGNTFVEVSAVYIIFTRYPHIFEVLTDSGLKLTPFGKEAYMIRQIVMPKIKETAYRTNSF